ncbi:hypothetical protein BKP45_21025 [Anaerobacillus alkalidiazotrophicus]|uniref:Uncharacterized protein n=1 Tax=Anaerobacillus alkalidiazotrophicus TaxID=472963 RepID=A0A1S2LVU8_9BACI|nr:hypothetical protein [Anaerobacillus alkalidiazotrophicus]OIJ16444.1 hypothetical protein BKP45_21310 [Anaerobacillus alkalidiazotrophicus]OIJ16492.1 hypothetical protein BKP45_21025 [Anaerobacillus alkalidiazotrophicus]
MFIVPNLEDVKIAIIKLQTEKYELFGFLLYTQLDEEIVEYMKNGIYDLDRLSGETCAIFVIESPSIQWIEYTRRTKHKWWKINEKMLIEELKRLKEEQEERHLDAARLFANITLSNIENSNIILGDNNIIDANNKISLKQLLEPDLNSPYGPSEAIDVARHFNLRFAELPSLIFFEDLDSHILWHLPLRGKSKNELTYCFRDFFDSEEFYNLLKSKGVNI